MPRFHFKIRNNIVTDDEEGSEHPDLEAARAHAVRAVRDLFCESVRAGKVDLKHSVIVTDNRGNELLKVSFRDVVNIVS